MNNIKTNLSLNNSFQHQALVPLVNRPKDFVTILGERNGLLSIKKEDLIRHAKFLAGDELEGRETTFPGNEQAAAYIAEQFKQFGLKPLQGDSYLCEFPVYVKHIGNNNILKIEGSQKEFTLKKDFVPFSFSGSKEIKSEIVFAGYGISAPQYNYDDYKELDVKGKTVLLLRHAPREFEDDKGMKKEDYMNFQKPDMKADIAKQKGAQAVLIVTDPLNHTYDIVKLKNGKKLEGITEDAGDSLFVKTFNNRFFMEEQIKKDEVEKVEKKGKQTARLFLKNGNIVEGAFREDEKNFLINIRFNIAKINKNDIEDIEKNKSPLPEGSPWPELSGNEGGFSMDLKKSLEAIPVLHVSIDFVKELLKDSGKDLIEVQKEIDKELTPKSFNINNKIVTIKADIQDKEKIIPNVVGVLKGCDPKLKDEYVIIGAHFDHLGKFFDGDKFDIIHNGADDNASGTSALLEIAEAFGENVHPSRSVVFVAFNGEEKGLLGAKKFVENSPIPMEKLFCMINMDMVGRNKSNNVSLIGPALWTNLKEICNDANKKATLEIDFVKGYTANSDHHAFHEKGVPNIFYSTGSHDDYHKVSDEASKLDYDKMEKITKHAFSTALTLTSYPDKPKRIDNPFSNR